MTGRSVTTRQCCARANHGERLNATNEAAIAPHCCRRRKCSNAFSRNGDKADECRGVTQRLHETLNCFQCCKLRKIFNLPPNV
jgi:hypothetical protein